MNKQEIVIISSLGLVFMLTNFALRDLVGARNMLETMPLAAGAGLIAFWWAFIFLKKKNEIKKIVYTLIYCALMCFIIFFTQRVKANSDIKEKKEVANKHIEVQKKQLLGAWNSPSPNNTDPNLSLFFLNDTLISKVNEEYSTYLYEVTADDHILVLDKYDKVKFDWVIDEINSSTLEIGNGKQSIVFKRINK